MDSIMWPVLLIFALPISMFSSVFSLFQFSRLYIAFVAVGRRPNSGIWSYIRPYHRQTVKALSQALGEPEKFMSSIDLTHVLLCAIFLALVIQLERLIASKKRR